jgi:hypothetical protein
MHTLAPPTSRIDTGRYTMTDWLCLLLTLETLNECSPMIDLGDAFSNKMRDQITLIQHH